MNAVGIDLVYIPGFAVQLQQPGSSFLEVFSAAERRVAQARRGGAHAENRWAEHLAGRWAAKEAFVKAWSQALFGKPPVLNEEDMVWAQVEVRADRFGRVGYLFAPSLERLVTASIGNFTTALSISHDQDYATAICNLYVGASN